MIEVDCYQCKSNKNELYDTENGHNLVKCLDCGLLYLNPRPGLEDINDLITDLEAAFLQI